MGIGAKFAVPKNWTKTGLERALSSSGQKTVLTFSPKMALDWH